MPDYKQHAKWVWIMAAVIAMFFFGLWIGAHKETIKSGITKGLGRRPARQAETSRSTTSAPATASPLVVNPLNSTEEMGGPLSPGEKQSISRYATRADFAKYASKLREQFLSEVEPKIFVPVSATAAIRRYPWKTNIVTTVFWIGEQPRGKKRSNYQSAWDQNWQANYGGFDNPDRSARRSYIPVAFIPRQNPFYCALPYNDVTHGQFKPEAPLVIPWFKQAFMGQGQSVCWHRWIAIRKGSRICYAQWEDVGPFREDHFQYVFGNERPKPNPNHGAGLNVSPAIRDYLGLLPTDVTDWQFVDVKDIPAGPWRSYGENNNFVLARHQMERRLTEQQQGGTVETSAQTTGSASSSEACRQFVQQFYDWYLGKHNELQNGVAHGSVLEITLQERRSSFSPELVRGLRDDLAASDKSPGELVGLDFDPFLAAQDTAERYVVGDVSPKADHYYVKVFRAPPSGKDSEPDVVPELVWLNGAWVFTNFHYGRSNDPVNENLVGVLRQLKKDRKKTTK